MNNKLYIFEQLTKNLEKEQRASLSFAFQREMWHDEWVRKQELEQLKKEITQDVLASISTTIDIDDVAKKVKELQNLIDKLGK